MRGVVRPLPTAMKYMLDVRVVYALIGVVLSICAHELVHIVMHFGDIQAVHLFPNPATIMAMDVATAPGYDIDTEELIAYTATALVQLITIIDVFAIHDSYDQKSAHKTLAGHDGTLSDHDSKLLLHIVSK